MLALVAVALAGHLEEAVSGLVSADMEEAGRARAALVAAGTDATPALVEALRSEDETLRHNCVVVLGQIKDPDAVEGVSRLLLDEGSGQRLRWAA